MLTSLRFPGVTLGVLLCLAAVLPSCAPSRRQPTAPVLLKNRNVEYVIMPYPTGFTVAVSYGHASCRPQPLVVAEVCKNTGIALAYAHAETQQKPIRSLEEQDVYLSLDPDSSAGINSCMATVTAEWIR